MWLGGYRVGLPIGEDQGSSRPWWLGGYRVGLPIGKDQCSSRPADVSKLGQFRSPHVALCLLEETLRAVDPVYLVSNHSLCQGK